MLSKAAAIAPTKVRTRETRGKRKLLQRSKGRRLRAQKTPPRNKEKCQAKVFSHANPPWKYSRNTRGKIVRGGLEHSKINLRGIYSLIWQSLKVAWSSFWVTIPLNFKQLVYHSEQPNRKSNATADLEKDESFAWGTFHRNRSYHSNVMTSSPILHES